MPIKYNNLKELRIKKQLLKSEVKDLEDLITFKNKKESLSAMTNGFIDPYLIEREIADGTKKIAFNTNTIVRDLTTSLKDSVTRNSIIQFARSEACTNVIENTLKIGLVTYAGKVAKNNMSSTSWRKKAIGLALIYVAPIVLKFIREKLEQYQKNKATSSLEKLI